MSGFERFAKALALTETHDLETAWGDAKSKTPVNVVGHDAAAQPMKKSNFMAVGRWQMHVAWFYDWCADEVLVGWSWDEAFRDALGRFYSAGYEKAHSPIVMAMTFHLGHVPKPPADWDETYAQRFSDYYAQLEPPATPAKGG